MAKTDDMTIHLTLDTTDFERRLRRAYRQLKALERGLLRLSRSLKAKGRAK